LLPGLPWTGGDLTTVRQDACMHLHRVVQDIRKMNKRAGVAINPATVMDHREI